MNQRAKDDIISSIANAKSFSEQAEGIARLEAFDRQSAQAYADARQIAWADTTVG